MNCPTCKGDMQERTLERHQYRESGLDTVILTNIRGFICPCGVTMPVLPDAEVISRVIAIEILTKKDRTLTADEILFLRKVIGASVKDIAEEVGVDAKTWNRWENDVQPMTHEVEKAFRYVIALELADSLNWKQLKRIAELAAKVLTALPLYPLHLEISVPSMEVVSFSI